MSPAFSLLLSISLLQAASPSSQVSVLESLAASLISHGFENVAVSGAPGSAVTVYYENRIYRYDLRAMGVVLAIAEEVLPEHCAVRMVPMKAGLPIVSVKAKGEDYRRFVSGEIDAESFARSLEISTNSTPPALNGCRNRSFRRLDLSAGPSFSVEFEQFDDSLRGRLNVVPQAESQLAKGLLATGQLIVPLVDEIEETSSGVRPGRVTLDWLTRHGPVVGLARAGIFDRERYGMSVGAGGWAWGDRILLTGRGDLTGKLALHEGTWEYSDPDVFTYSLGAEYRYPAIDVTVKAAFGRFLGEEHGGRVEVIRSMGELEIGFFAIRSGSDTLGGLVVDLPLPLSHYPKPAGIRFKTVPHLVWEYRDEVTAAGRMPGGGLSIHGLYKSLAPVFIRNNVSEWIESRRLI